mgnify:CR=1 FL=1
MVKEQCLYADTEGGPYNGKTGSHEKEVSVDIHLPLFSLCHTLGWAGIVGAVVRFLPFDQKVFGLVPALPRFESLCNLLFHLS